MPRCADRILADRKPQPRRLTFDDRHEMDESIAQIERRGWKALNVFPGPCIELEDRHTGHMDGLRETREVSMQIPANPLAPSTAPLCNY